MLFSQGRLVRFTSFARPETGVLGRFAGGMKPHVFRPGQARGAGGAAIHPGGFDGIIECPIGAGIAIDQGGPAWIVFHGFSEFAGSGGHGLFSDAVQDGGNLIPINKTCAPGLAFEFGCLAIIVILSLKYGSNHGEPGKYGDKKNNSSRHYAEWNRYLVMVISCSRRDHPG